MNKGLMFWANVATQHHAPHIINTIDFRKNSFI
jgi:hypothetical protein